MTLSQNIAEGGVLPIWKARGVISKDVSRLLTPILGKGVKIGHVGTLDPMAEGVLPILLGNATRLQDDLLEFPKSYECELEFGYETDTLDACGVITKNASYEHIKSDDVFSVLKNMVGIISQTPPIYSAVKKNGRPLYEYARTGRDVDLKSLARTITVFSCEPLYVNLPFVGFRVSCSKGTYVRVLAQDLALQLRSLGTLTKLRRAESSGFGAGVCLDLERLQGSVEEQRKLLSQHVVSMASVRLPFPTVKLTDSKLYNRLEQGQRLRNFELEDVKSHRKFDGSCISLNSKFLLIDSMHQKAFGLVEMQSQGGSSFLAMKRSLQ